MSTTDESTGAEEALRTANGAADLLDEPSPDTNSESADSGVPTNNAGDDEASGSADDDSTSSPISTTDTGEGGGAVAALISEAISMTTPTLSPVEQSESANNNNNNDANAANESHDNQEDGNDSTIMESASAAAASGKPSISNVLSIVNQVLKQKESGTTTNGEELDIAAIANQEVEKFYDAAEDNNDHNNGKDEIYAEYHRQVADASSGSVPTKSHPWSSTTTTTDADADGAAGAYNDDGVGGSEDEDEHQQTTSTSTDVGAIGDDDGVVGSTEDEIKSLFKRKGSKGAASIISSKIKAAIGSHRNNNTNKQQDNNHGGGENYNSRGPYAPGSTPPATMFRDEYDPSAVASTTGPAIHDDFADLCQELGITPETHPNLRHPYRRNSSLLDNFNYATGRQLLNSSRNYCIIGGCLVGITIGITAAITKGFQHASHRQQQLHNRPKNILDESTNENKDWWTGDKTDESALTIDKYMNKKNKEQLSGQELEDYYYQLSDAYLPIWFDRREGWEGTSYEEALEFCRSHDDFVPCPYEVYCPGQAMKLIFNEEFEDTGGERSWAPILDDWNEWVQVGSTHTQCVPYSGVYHGVRPEWGKKAGVGGEDAKKLTEHIMCCLEHPLGDDFDAIPIPTPHDIPHAGQQIPPDVEAEHGEGVDDPIPPPPLDGGDEADDGTPQSESSLTEMEQYVYENYRPFWFSDADGWDGTTYQAGKEFCESIPLGPGETFHLCPIRAYCANGYNVPKPLTYQMDPWDDGLQWAPVSNNVNGWLMVGKTQGDRPKTCNTYLEMYHNDPAFGIDGSQTELKKHILCCQVEPESEKKNELAGTTPQGSVNNPSDVPTGPMDGGTPWGSGASLPVSPYNTLPDGVTPDTYEPAWYDRRTGWHGSTYQEAVDFCSSTGHTLCPYQVYCGGPKSIPFAGGIAEFLGSDFEDREYVLSRDEQWAPILNAENEWVQLLEGDDVCYTYTMLNGGRPSWGSSTEGDKTITGYLMCCHNTEAEKQTEQGKYLGGVGASHPVSPYNTLPDGVTPDTYEPAWYDRRTGWHGSTYQEAVDFCSSTGHTLCPYQVYCGGPKSIPFAGGIAEFLGSDFEDREYVLSRDEQWAPILNAENEWVQLLEGDDVCYTYSMLNGGRPSWGSSTEGDKTITGYLMCCHDPASVEKQTEQGKYLGGTGGGVNNPSDVPMGPMDGGTPWGLNEEEGQKYMGGEPPVVAQDENGHHTGAGNSAPHAGEHTYEDPITNMKKTLQPAWYSVQDGWRGGSHTDAMMFCDSKNKELCPLAAVCPHGPLQSPFEGAVFDSSDPSEQWAPTINRPNQWLLIGPWGESTSTQCIEYDKLNGQNPSWGLDGSSMELKRHVLCCKKVSGISQIPVQEQQQPEQPFMAEVANPTTPEASGGVVSQDTNAPLAPPAGVWFQVLNGWNAGSHEDGMHFCARQKIAGEKMELCNYEQYCPNGPSRPAAGGHSTIGFTDEDIEQWAPIAGEGANQWVMVGMRGHNHATECLTHDMLNGEAPSWGLDNSNPEHKQYIYCCFVL